MLASRRSTPGGYAAMPRPAHMKSLLARLGFLLDGRQAGQRWMTGVGDEWVWRLCYNFEPVGLAWTAIDRRRIACNDGE
jgi:hypothetical protein